jgi:DNA-binding MarR family transcriptional regulator
MSKAGEVPFETTRFVRDTCLCLHLHRAARALARRFDEALRPFGITHGQFSLMMSLNRPQPPSIGSVASGLVMDRTTLTAALKPLQRRGLVEVMIDPDDRRSRRLKLTRAGHVLLASAVPIWRRTHAAVDRQLPHAGPERLRADLRALDREVRGAGRKRGAAAPADSPVSGPTD